MFKNQKELPLCEYGFPFLPSNAQTCGLPATHVWNWGAGDMFVCEKHNNIIEESEGKNNPSNEKEKK